MVGGANPVLAVRDSLPKYIADLEEQLAKKLGEIMVIQHELAVARTLISVTPAETKGKE